jgi:Glycine rich protein
MRVGGKGEEGSIFDVTDIVTVAGGFNGGGTNTCQPTGCPTPILGGAGGGASDVRTCVDALGNRLLVAGRGRGAGRGGNTNDSVTTGQR